MNEAREVICRSQWAKTLWVLVGLGVTGVVSALLLWAFTGLAVWPAVAVLSAVAALAPLNKAVARVRADAHGVHSRTLLRRRSVRWSDIADLQVRLKYVQKPSLQDVRRLIVVRRGGRKWTLPLPVGYTTQVRRQDRDFTDNLEAFRELHRRHGTPESSHLVVVSNRTAGSGWAGSLLASVLLLVLAGVAAYSVPSTDAYLRDWRAAGRCTAGTPAAERGETCWTTVPAVIEYTEPSSGKGASWLYFADARPMERLSVRREAAEAFREGDEVELTVWRGSVKKVAGEHHTWREYDAPPGFTAASAALLVLIAGYPAARVLVRVRRRRRPEDEELPPVLPFLAVLAGTALWLLPLCYLHPTALFATRLTTVWPLAGALVSLALFTWAWHATRFREPVESGPGRGAMAHHPE
ncbi:PH domain-containing protein [Streptomyces prasinus]|uniref:PH domain-containing protein n=1 Tax=Streptomyces prasinus TaxID=67345 RepID=UPI0036378DFF